MQKPQLLPVVCLCVCAAAAVAPPVVAQAAAARQACPARTAPMSAGEIALARGDTDAAVAAFSGEMSAAGADAERAHNGQIRALLAANKLDDAEADAKAWLEQSPRDPWARVSLGEVQLRKGQIPAAFNTPAGGFERGRLHRADAGGPGANLRAERDVRDFQTHS